MTDTSRKLLGITGWKNSGKTTLTERLVAELVARGHRIATVKHAHHAFDIDHEGRDSFRHRKAGAFEVAVVSSKRWALIHELEHEADEPPLDFVLSKMAPADLTLIEGYKREGHQKIEMRRASAGQSEPLAPNDPSIIAVVSDTGTADTDLPVFHADDVASLADFVETRFLKQ
jgi:molybdopterin-guanine dinucleotide biosynthesis protein B